MIDKAKCFTEAMRQLALEYNAKPEDFTANQVTVTTPAKPDGVRLYSHEMPFFQMASTGNGVVITANEVLHPFLKEFTGDTERFKHPYWLFELPHLLCIERELNKYDYTLSSTFHMFLPGKPHKARVLPCAFTLKWFDNTSVKTLYPNTDFPNALSEKENPDRPDVLALAAYDGDEIAALAGASADTDALWQVGIDVKERYRGHGLGTTLVSLLCDRIEALGKTPFYGTVLANLHSQNIALNTGFYPAWVEISSFKKEETKG